MRRTMLLVMTAAMVMALMMVAMALPVFAGGQDDDEENDNESPIDGPARNGQIAFRRYFNAEQTKGALFTMNRGVTIVEMCQQREEYVRLRQRIPLVP